MLTIYLPEKSPRSIYVFNHIFSNLFPLPYSITHDLQVFVNHTGPKFMYHKENIPENYFFWKSAGILEETTIHIINPVVKNELIYLTEDMEDFDPFSAIFYLLSRYEEYTRPHRDQHGRFLPENSVIFQNRLELIPLVEKYAGMVITTLKTWFPGQINYTRAVPKALITIDIDSAYAYLHKPWYRKQILVIKSFFRKEETPPLKVIYGKKKDPYDSYDYLIEMAEKTGFNFLYFFLLAGWNRYDKNISPKNLKYRQLIKKLSQTNLTGIHPSYYSPERTELYKKEIRILSEITGRPVTASRQHYLRFSLPFTYRELIKNGITEEYSMGYAGRSGFRAGTCSPFYWFDMEQNAVTDLKIFPVSYMDNTFSDYYGMNPEESINKIKTLAEIIYQNHGMFIPLWHNHTVNDYGPYKGWRKVFEENLSLLKEMGYE